jgi:hypothetical protein
MEQHVFTEPQFDVTYWLKRGSNPHTAFAIQDFKSQGYAIRHDTGLSAQPVILQAARNRPQPRIVYFGPKNDGMVMEQVGPLRMT